MCAGTGGPSMGFVFKESGNAEGEVPENSNYVQPSAKGFRIQTQGGKSEQDLLIFMKSNTWDSLQTHIFLE